MELSTAPVLYEGRVLKAAFPESRKEYRLSAANASLVVWWRRCLGHGKRVFTCLRATYE